MKKIHKKNIKPVIAFPSVGLPITIEDNLIWEKTTKFYFTSVDEVSYYVQADYVDNSDKFVDVTKKIDAEDVLEDVFSYLKIKKNWLPESKNAVITAMNKYAELSKPEIKSYIRLDTTTYHLNSKYEDAINSIEGLKNPEKHIFGLVIVDSNGNC